MDPQISEAIERCRQGDIDGLELIYRQYRELVFRICYRMAADSARAQDWTQEIFIRVFEKIRSYKGNARFSTWLYRVATNYCLDRLKANRKTVPLGFLRLQAADTDPEKSVSMQERQERRLAVWTALQHLSPKLRAVLVLKELEGLGYTEISQILDIRKGTVGSRLNQARKELAQSLPEPLGQE